MATAANDDSDDDVGAEDDDSVVMVRMDGLTLLIRAILLFADTMVLPL